jgi:hypothetical protein
MAYACVGTDRSRSISCESARLDGLLYYRIAEKGCRVSCIEVGGVAEVEVTAAEELLVPFAIVSCCSIGIVPARCMLDLLLLRIRGRYVLCELGIEGRCV